MMGFTSRPSTMIVLGCSTGGEIHGSDVLDDSLSITSLGFEHTTLKSAEAMLDNASGSYDAGKDIGHKLAGPALKTIFLLSDGTRVNGSELPKRLARFTHQRIQEAVGCLQRRLDIDQQDDEVALLVDEDVE